MEKMGIDQLKALKEQADLEVNLLQDSLNNIRTATVRLDAAAAALNDLSLRPQGFVYFTSPSSISAMDDYKTI
jgi:prefoldin alpha subunit